MNFESPRTISILAAMAFASACGGSVETPDAASLPDAGRDAAPSDGGAGDAFVGNDAFVPSDAGTDAFVEVDAFVAVDAFVPVDAFSPPETPGPGDLVITEIQAAPVGYADDALAEWVEIHNPSTTITYDLNGCIFSDKPADDDYTISRSLLVAPGDYVVLSSAAFTMATHGFVSDEVYGAMGTGLSGSGDAPVLKCGGAIVDVVDYAAASFADPDAMEGHTLQLDVASLDATANDDGASWCFSTMVFHTSLAMDNAGTPGAANVACP